MAGRPELFPDGRQVCVLLSRADYEALSTLVDKARVERPGFSFGELVRRYIRRGLAEDKPFRAKAAADPSQDGLRRLQAIARSATLLARDMKRKGKP